MAEARAAVNNIRVGSLLQLDAISSRAKFRGPQVHTLDGGLLIVIPSADSLLHLLLHKFKHLYYHFQTACWPVPVWSALAGITVFVGGVMYSPDHSWWRSGPIASFLWSVDENFVGLFGVASYLPKYFRICYLSGWSAVFSMLVVALVQRFCMRILLNYKNWMYEKKPSYLTLVWGAILRGFFLGQREPLTYSFQNAMPRLAVPALQCTINKYLRSVQPLLSEKEYENVEREAHAFQKSTEARKLQTLLIVKSFLSGNYVSDWWEKYIYLRSRSPILINSNYYGLGYANMIPSHHQTHRAAVLVHLYARFKVILDTERLKPMTIRGTVPICMRQYERMFCLCRIPGRDDDILRHSDSLHIAVLYKGTFWRVEVFDHQRSPLSIHEIQNQLDFIVESVGNVIPVPDVKDAEANLPALTALNRTRWAEIREEHFGSGLNKLSLDEIEHAMFFLHLDDRSPRTWSETARLSLHGEGNTRWCDKSFNLVVYHNGEAAVHAEHSWADAPVIAHGWEWVLYQEYALKPYQPDGYLKASEDIEPLADHCSKTPKANLRRESHEKRKIHPAKLEWRFWPEARDAILEAAQLAAEQCRDLHLVVDSCEVSQGGYGKGFMKKHKCSPDAWIQVALQIAYYRDRGSLALTYEAAAVRLFNEGRTETIRSVSVESKNAVMQILSEGVPKKDKIAALYKAAEQHQKYSRDASLGRGVDRHLFALYVAAKGLGMEVNFLKDALSMPWKLSTSQIPQRQTEFITTDPNMVSPSGGFGPVADDGYGVSYMMADDDRTFFHVSSKRSCKVTDSERFMREIMRALEDLRSIFED
eukprot:763663-Hanusia_phi.AAC.5